MTIIISGLARGRWWQRACLLNGGSFLQSMAWTGLESSAIVSIAHKLVCDIQLSHKVIICTVIKCDQHALHATPLWTAALHSRHHSRVVAQLTAHSCARVLAHAVLPRRTSIDQIHYLLCHKRLIWSVFSSSALRGKRKSIRESTALKCSFFVADKLNLAAPL